MFIQAKKVKGRTYFYLVANKKEAGVPIKDFEKCLGDQQKVDSLFDGYAQLKQRLGQ